MRFRSRRNLNAGERRDVSLTAGPTPGAPGHALPTRADDAAVDADAPPTRAVDASPTRADDVDDADSLDGFESSDDLDRRSALDLRRIRRRRRVQRDDVVPSLTKPKEYPRASS